LHDLILTGFSRSDTRRREESTKGGLFSGRGNDFLGKAEEKISRAEDFLGKAEEKIGRAEDFSGLFFLSPGKAEDFSGLFFLSSCQKNHSPGYFFERNEHFAKPLLPARFARPDAENWRLRGSVKRW